jgi:hypothetical protein
MGFPSKGTKADKRLKANKPKTTPKPAFGGKKANPFTKKKP